MHNQLKESDQTMMKLHFSKIETSTDGTQYAAVLIKSIKEGGYFKRKPDAAAVLIRNHYNRKDQFGPASFSCSYAEDMNKEICLKPTTTVFVEL